MLNWLEPKHLDVPLDLQNPEVQEQIIKGQQGMGGVTTPTMYDSFPSLMIAPFSEKH